MDCFYCGESYLGIMRSLALRLLALERSQQPNPHQHLHEAVRVCEKLRLSLTRFSGADGFASPWRERKSHPSRVTVNPDCSMDALETLAAAEADGGAEAAVAPAAQLLGLLVTFIGESLTLRLLRESWPLASFHAQ